MNKFDPALAKEAQLRYLQFEYEVVRQGSHVRCAVTGKNIPLDELRYWSVERQEAYVDVEASNQREAEVRGLT